MSSDTGQQQQQSPPGGPAIMKATTAQKQKKIVLPMFDSPLPKRDYFKILENAHLFETSKSIEERPEPGRLILYEGLKRFKQDGYNWYPPTLKFYRTLTDTDPVTGAERKYYKYYNNCVEQTEDGSSRALCRWVFCIQGPSPEFKLVHYFDKKSNSQNEDGPPASTASLIDPLLQGYTSVSNYGGSGIGSSSSNNNNPCTGIDSSISMASTSNDLGRGVATSSSGNNKNRIEERESSTSSWYTPIRPEPVQQRLQPAMALQSSQLASHALPPGTSPPHSYIPHTGAFMPPHPGYSQPPQVPQPPAVYNMIGGQDALRGAALPPVQHHNYHHHQQLQQQLQLPQPPSSYRHGEVILAPMHEGYARYEEDNSYRHHHHPSYPSMYYADQSGAPAMSSNNASPVAPSMGSGAFQPHPQHHHHHHHPYHKNSYYQKSHYHQASPPSPPPYPTSSYHNPNRMLPSAPTDERNGLFGLLHTNNIEYNLNTMAAYQSTYRRYESPRDTRIRTASNNNNNNSHISSTQHEVAQFEKDVSNMYEYLPPPSSRYNNNNHINSSSIDRLQNEIAQLEKDVSQLYAYLAPRTKTLRTDPRSLIAFTRYLKVKRSVREGTQQQQQQPTSTSAAASPTTANVVSVVSLAAAGTNVVAPEFMHMVEHIKDTFKNNKLYVGDLGRQEWRYDDNLRHKVRIHIREQSGVQFWIDTTLETQNALMQPRMSAGNSTEFFIDNQCDEAVIVGLVNSPNPGEQRWLNIRTSSNVGSMADDYNDIVDDGRYLTSMLQPKGGAHVYTSLNAGTDEYELFIWVPRLGIWSSSRFNFIVVGS